MSSSRPNRVCVFAASSDGDRPEYREAAATLGGELARRGHGLVYGGSGRGLMGAAADAALAEGGEVIGVIPEGLLGLEQYHRGLAELHIVGSMHERKAKMADLSGAFVALPGGIGTLEELLEITTWSKLGFHDKACGVVNTRGYFDPLAAMLDATVSEGFMAAKYREILVFDPDPVRLLDLLEQAGSI